MVDFEDTKNNSVLVQDNTLVNFLDIKDMIILGYKELTNINLLKLMAEFDFRSYFIEVYNFIIE